MYPSGLLICEWSRSSWGWEVIASARVPAFTLNDQKTFRDRLCVAHLISLYFHTDRLIIMFILYTTKWQQRKFCKILDYVQWQHVFMKMSLRMISFHNISTNYDIVKVREDIKSLNQSLMIYGLKIKVWYTLKKTFCKLVVHTVSVKVGGPIICI